MTGNEPLAAGKSPAPGAELWLVRHGETTWNASRRYQGQSESDLSPAGRQQAEALRHRLAGMRFDRAYSSDLRRAFHTAEIILPGRDPVIQSSRLLRELHFGLFEGLTLDQIRISYPSEYQAWADDLVNIAPPSGESLHHQAARAADFLVALEEQSGRTLIVAHGGSIRAILFHALGIELHLYWRVAIANASLTVLDQMQQRWRLRVLNDVCHLQDLTHQYRGGVGASYGIRLP